MLTSHGQKHAGDFRILAHVLVERLANIVPQRNFVFSFASDLATMTAETASGVDEPAVAFTIVRSLHSVGPKFLGLEFRFLIVFRFLISEKFASGFLIHLNRVLNRFCHVR